MNTQIFHLIKYDLKGLFYVYFNLNFRSYSQIFVLVYIKYRLYRNLIIPNNHTTKYTLFFVYKKALKIIRTYQTSFLPSK